MACVTMTKLNSNDAMTEQCWELRFFLNEFLQESKQRY